VHKTLKTLALAFFCFLLANHPIRAGDIEDTIAYKLAILHTQSLQRKNFWLEKRLAPSPATITEFQWIMDGLKTRCVNPENTIADTIVESWLRLKEKGEPISVLGTARALYKVTRDTSLLGTGKVNLRMVANYWLINTYPNLFKK